MDVAYKVFLVFDLPVVLVFIVIIMIQWLSGEDNQQNPNSITDCQIFFKKRINKNK